MRWYVLGLVCAITLALPLGGQAETTAVSDLSPYSADTLLDTISEARGQVVVLNFWATWCQGCRQEIAELNQIRKQYSQKEVVVLGIALDRQPRTAARFAEKHDFQYQLGYADGGLEMLYDLNTIPKTIVYGPEGQKHLEHTGFLSAGQLAQTIDDLLNL
ncbi:MAG: TlpA family protein disulfide reductase [Thermodesulfobacteriota bacterium]